MVKVTYSDVANLKTALGFENDILLFNFLIKL